MSLTLDEALDNAIHTRWRDSRSLKRNRCQAQKGIEGLRDAYVLMATRAKGKTSDQSIRCAGQKSLSLSVADVTPAIVQAAVTVWLSDRLEPSTVVARLNCLSAIGVSVNGCRPTLKRKLKWWLSLEEEVRLVVWLRGTPIPRYHLMADYIEWATRVGCRIEETLALQWADVHERPAIPASDFRAAQPARTLITVPGLKTNMAQATLPISTEAAAILRKRREAGEARPFDVTYRVLAATWQEARGFLGLPDPSVATLKALRRSAARSLHVTKGMPLDMVRQYLRHEDVDTTMGYLRLTGGYGEEEIAKWL